MPEPRVSLSDVEIARELQAIQVRLAALADAGDADAITDELGDIRATLRRLAADNETVRRRLGASLGLRLDD